MNYLDINIEKENTMHMLQFGKKSIFERSLEEIIEFKRNKLDNHIKNFGSMCIK